MEMGNLIMDLISFKILKEQKQRNQKTTILSPEQFAQELIVLGLRLKEGIDRKEFVIQTRGVDLRSVLVFLSFFSFSSS